MKKRIIIALCCLTPLLFSATANSAEGPYLSANFGIAFPNDSDITDSTLPGINMELSYDTGWIIGAAAGYGFRNFRVEGELSYESNDIDKTSVLGVSFDSTGDVSCTALLVNGYYDFVNSSAFTPFISAGVGYATIDVNDYNITGAGLPNYNDDDSVFAYQLGVGIGYAVNENVTIDFRYRYFATEDAEFDTTEVESSSHNFLLGIRYYF